MAAIKQFYDISKKTDSVLYESSNVIFTRFVEDPDENKGDLFVVFKEGKQYKYEGVEYNDYLMFKHGCVEGSSGKSLNSYIIKKYAAEKIEDANMDELLKEVNRADDKEHTYFIHGDYGFSDEIFETYYVPTFEYILELDPDARFIFSMNDNSGYVHRSLKYLTEVNNIDASRLTGYSLTRMDYDSRLYEYTKDVVNVDGESTIDLYNVMIDNSVKDIAYVTEENLKEIYIKSHSAYSILSRYFK